MMGGDEICGGQWRWKERMGKNERRKKMNGDRRKWWLKVLYFIILFFIILFNYFVSDFKKIG